MTLLDVFRSSLSAGPWLRCSVLGVVLAGGILVPTVAGAFGEGDEDALQTTGDILQIALPVAAGVSTFFTNPEPGQLWDRQGTRQFAFHYASAWSTTYVLKFIVSKQRPNGENRSSFPSGHTMSAFAGASFIDGRYGWHWGLPAYALAGLTGYSRVASSWHFADDVVAGASIGMIYSWLYVSPQPGKFSLLPTVQGDLIGFTLNYQGDSGETEEAWKNSDRGTAYHFAFGPAFVVTNRARSVEDGGNEFQLTDLEGNNDPTTTASATVTIPFGRTHRHEVLLHYVPFEAVDRGSFASDVRFAGRDFPAGTRVDSSWYMHEIAAQYEYDVLRSSRLGLELGVGMGIQDSRLALKEEGEPKEAAVVVEDLIVYPYVHLAVEYAFSRRWAFDFEVKTLATSGEYIYSGFAMFRYSLSRAWDLGLVYTRFSRLIDSGQLYNETKYDVPQLVVSRYW